MKNIILKAIKLYQKTFSPDHSILFAGGTARCRFYPSCSQYTYESIERNGLTIGLARSLWRVIRCSPLSKGGIDLPK